MHIVKIKRWKNSLKNKTKHLIFFGVDCVLPQKLYYHTLILINTYFYQRKTGMTI